MLACSVMKLRIVNVDRILTAREGLEVMGKLKDCSYLENFATV